MTLLVHMLSGQVVDDFEADAHRLATGMDVPLVGITPRGHGWIEVALVDHAPPTAVMPLAV